MNENTENPIRAIVLGAGYIGTDLIYKLAKSELIECVRAVGRRAGTAGLRRAERLGIETSTSGINSLLETPDAFDLVFDCTDAESNRAHWEALKPLKKRLINLTPAKSGKMVVPCVNGDEANESYDVNLISCGGQTAIPLLHAIKGVIPDIEYIELVTSAASNSVGMGTRVNLDEYIDITSSSMVAFTRATAVKTMVNLSPAKPPVPFRVTLFIQAKNYNLAEVKSAVETAIKGVKQYCPGYRLRHFIAQKDGTILLDIEVTGGGDFLPVYAGNLDIINSAAVNIAERI